MSHLDRHPSRVFFRAVLGALLVASLVESRVARAVQVISPAVGRRVIVFNGENNRLNAYDPASGFLKQTVIPSSSDSPQGLDINAQICFDPEGSRRFIAGEDTNQPNPPQGWGIFQLSGQRVGSLSAQEIGKLTPTYQNSPDNAENYGCGFLSDHRALTTDVGDQADGPGNGQLIVWFPPFDSFQVRYCKLDIGIGTAGAIMVDAKDRIYVASSRVDPGIYRYTGPFPTSDDASGGCGQTDSTGAPLADTLNREKFIDADQNIPTPNAIVDSGRGTFYVSSVFNGVIAEFDQNGNFMRRILEPPAGETLGSMPFSTGTPLGIGVDSAGTLYYADIGIVISDRGVGPGNHTGTVRRIRFEAGAPLPPETMDVGLGFPDGVGILEIPFGTTRLRRPK